MTEAPQDPREQSVRDLLADLGSAGSTPPEPVPDHVAARLEDTLAALVAEREAERISQERYAGTGVVPLRPRWMPRLAAGAAAVIVLGLGGLAAADFGVFDGQGSSSSDSAASSRAGSQAESETEAGGGVAASPQDAPQRDQSSASPTPLSDTQALVGTLEVSTADFATDVRTILAARPALKGSASLRSTQDDAAAAAPENASTCRGPVVTDGSRTTLVSVDGTTGVLVVHPRRAGRQLVEAYDCRGTRRLASTTLTP